MTRIEICGGIAAGKTTLASLLVAGCDWSLALEPYEHNPFLARFYRSPATWVEEKNLCFLLQHTGEIKAAAATDGLVCDFAVFQDLAYASLCSAEHYTMMQSVYARFAPDPATLIIRLTCSVDTQLARIKARARPYEADISAAYLDSLNTAIDSELAKVTPSTAVHSLASDELDFAHCVDTAERVRHRILAPFLSATT